MSRLTALIACLLFVFSSFAPSAFGQAKGEEKREDVQTMNRKAIDALRAKKFDDGIAILMRILEVQPKDKGTAYNLGCAYSLKGDVDKSIEWLGISLDWGWGKSKGRIDGSTEELSEVEMLKKDADFENVRKDPRFEKILERASKAVDAKTEAMKKGEEYAAKAATYIPEKVAGLKEMPLLVVLHDAGATKDQVVAGRWKAIADELGFALVAPSGKVAAGEDPAKGMNWYDTLEEYTAKPFLYERSVNDVVSAFQKEHPIDRSKVVVAGEGVGGLVALNVAINGPGLYKGVVTLNGKFQPALYAGKAPAAGKMGLKVALLHDAPAADAPKEAGPAEVASAETKSLQTWGLGGEAKVLAADPADADRKKALVEAIRAVLVPAPAAAPASAPAPK